MIPVAFSVLNVHLSTGFLPTIPRIGETIAFSGICYKVRSVIYRLNSSNEFVEVRLDLE